MLLDPLTESEMVRWSPPVKVKKAKTIKGTPVVYWTCYCGKLCQIAEQALDTGTVGGECNCGRDWNIDRVDMSAIIIEAVEPRYKFMIVVDRGPSWRVHRKRSVGINYENLYP